MSFYVTLPSHSNRREFPNNQANSFKIRLPQPLQLTGGGWQVGLSAISLPDARVNLYELVKKNGYVMGVSWDQTYPKPNGKDEEMTSRVDIARTIINDVKDLDWVVDGVSFMKAVIAHLEQQRKELAIQGGRFTNDQGKHTYIKFKWGRRRSAHRQHQYLPLWPQNTIPDYLHQVGSQDGMVTVKLTLY